MGKHTKHSNINVKMVVIILLAIICISSIGILIKLKIDKQKDNKTQEEISKVLSTIDIPSEDITPEVTERMLQLEKLKTENQEIIGWLEIEDTNINYPVLQGTDNDYYLTHSYKKEIVNRRFTIFR